MQLQIIRRNRKSFFNSKALHEALELDHNHYSRWITNVLDNPCLVSGIDYVKAENGESGPGRPGSQYLLSMTVSEAICIETGTAIAKKVREVTFGTF